MEIKSTDIIIPLYKPGENFAWLLSMLKRQTFKPGRIIIINTVPEDDANAEKVEKLISSVFPGLCGVTLRHIKKSEFDHAGTRRMAAGLSDADSFICMTDDAVPADDYMVEKLVAALNSDGLVAVAYARQLPRRGASAAEIYTRSFNYPSKSRVKGIKDMEELGIKTFFASNVCCAYKRSIYDKTGGFIENAGFNEDMIYAASVLKQGYLSCYQAEARVYHSHNNTIKDEFSRNFDNGMSQAMHPEIFEGIRSESEGIKLVKNTCSYLISKRHALEVPGLIIRSGAKYIGFKLGQSYKKLPDALILKFAMNKTYVEKHVVGRT